MTREDKEAIVRRLKAMYNEAEDNETKEALFYATEALQENESLARSVNEASELLRKKRPRGEWERNPQTRTLITRTCTLCGGRSAVGNFCMWCGAEMRMKEDEANENHN